MTGTAGVWRVNSIFLNVSLMSEKVSIFTLYPLLWALDVQLGARVILNMEQTNGISAKISMEELEDITRWRGDTDFIFEWQEQYPNIILNRSVSVLTLSLPCFSVQMKHKNCKNLNSVQQQHEHLTTIRKYPSRTFI